MKDGGKGTVLSHPSYDATFRAWKQLFSRAELALQMSRVSQNILGTRNRHRSRSRLMRERTSQETTGSSRSRSRSRLMRERTPQETTNGVLGSQRSNLASGEERMTKGELLASTCFSSDGLVWLYEHDSSLLSNSFYLPRQCSETPALPNIQIHPALPSDHTMLTSPNRRPRDREKET